MSRALARCVHAATLLVGLTGLVYGWQRYLHRPGPEPEDPALALDWSGVHPWQDEVRALHLVGAPLIVFVCGVLWTGHVWPRVRSGYRARRGSGLALVLSLAPMVLSGVLLQVSEAPALRTFWAWTHGVTGLLWLAAYAAHQLRPLREPQLRRPPPPSS